MVMKLELPDAAYKIVLEPVEGQTLCNNITLLESDEFKSWLDEHNITDYDIIVEEFPPNFVIEFKHDADALMFKLSWADKY
jgi:hypothetical protein